MKTIVPEECLKLEFCVAGRDWQILRPADLESLWNALDDEEFAEDERLPYWVELWPASFALADWIFERKSDVYGKYCLDLGCGLGFTALVAAWCGGKVVAMDYEEQALRFARLNTAVNSVPAPLWTLSDWRFPAFHRQAFEFIWGGDIMYERRFVTPVLDFIGFALAPGGRVWLAEPNRNVYDDFRAALIQRGWVSKKVYSSMVEPIYEQKSKVTVNLWEITWAG